MPMADVPADHLLLYSRLGTTVRNARVFGALLGGLARVCFCCVVVLNCNEAFCPTSKLQYDTTKGSIYCKCTNFSFETCFCHSVRIIGRHLRCGIVYILEVARRVNE